VFVLGRVTLSRTMVDRAARGGYAPAQASLSARSKDATESFAYAQLAASQKNREGLAQLGLCYFEGKGCERDEQKAIALWREAADMGQSEAQASLANAAYGENDWQRCMWLGRAAVRRNWAAEAQLLAVATDQLELLEEGRGVGRVLFELGAVFRAHSVSKSDGGKGAAIAQRCVELYDRWVAIARAAIACWLGVARRLNVSRDVRMLIARTLWRERAEWSRVWLWLKEDLLYMEMSELFKWWDLLDDIVQHALSSDEFAQHVELARACFHPDSKWLASLFPRGCLAPGVDPESVLRGQGHDPRALFLVGACSKSLAEVRRAAELGYSPAQAACGAAIGDAQESFSWLQKAAAQRNRDAIFRLGMCYRAGEGCECDPAKAIALWREAAELEHPEAQHFWAMTGCAEDDWRRYEWLGKAAARKYQQSALLLVEAAESQLRLWDSGWDGGRVLLELGRVFKGHLAQATIFGISCGDDECAAAQRCVHLHDQWTAMARAAIACWLAIARRFDVAKDVRLLVAETLWDERADWSKVRPS
jgi:TPR repeat protein